MCTQNSRDHDEVFSFRIGAGVIDGWSEGIATMRQGEVAEFVIAPEKVSGWCPVRASIVTTSDRDIMQVFGVEFQYKMSFR